MLRQNVIDKAVPGQDYRFKFKAKVSGTPKAELRMVVRFKFRARSKSVSPCKRKFCNFFRTLIVTDVTNEDWGDFVTEEIDFFRKEV